MRPASRRRHRGVGPLHRHEPQALGSELHDQLEVVWSWNTERTVRTGSLQRPDQRFCSGRAARVTTCWHRHARNATQDQPWES
ncbi:hypothetical protein DVS28_a2839 [Euzebya pacifica]|uniref:Uncharacterized protein n=1 Tax=Euzebya pacifica TaxID=1608957 RepID=A0A346XZ71_9ACTN|nr:hypothetical protein DVS28_a2839 [Euzebya pacifica]